MSNLILNVRFGGRFLQLARQARHPGASRWSWTKPPLRKPSPGEPWFQIYEAPWL